MTSQPSALDSSSLRPAGRRDSCGTLSKTRHCGTRGSSYFPTLSPATSSTTGSPADWPRLLDVSRRSSVRRLCELPPRRRSLADLRRMVQAGATRIGTSSGIKILQEAAGQNVSSDGTKYGLFVFLGSGVSLRLDYQDVSSLRTMGIDTVAPGNHKTGCGKGHWECKKGEPEVLRLRNPAILYFQSEGAASVYFWSASTRTFRRVWVSD